ncbi:hypothetical protein E2562_022814, partial [Oryza meyeriana var. granulata]
WRIKRCLCFTRTSSRAYYQLRRPCMGSLFLPRPKKVYLNLKSLLDNKKDLTRLLKSDELNDLGYLKKAKGKKANKVVRSEAFWKSVDMAVNFFEPLANVLRRMDSDVPAMGFLHGCMLEAKKEIAMRFDNDENSFKVAWDIIDK